MVISLIFICRNVIINHYFFTPVAILYFRWDLLFPMGFISHMVCLIVSENIDSSFIVRKSHDDKKRGLNKMKIILKSFYML